jgi:chromosome segregation ATPase
MDTRHDPHLRSALAELDVIKREYELQEHCDPGHTHHTTGVQGVNARPVGNLRSSERKAVEEDVDIRERNGGLKLDIADQLVHKLFQSNVELEARLNAAQEPLVTLRAELKQARAEAAWYKNHLEGFKARLTNACAQCEIDNAVVPVLKETLHALEEENCELFVRLAIAQRSNQEAESESVTTA